MPGEGFRKALNTFLFRGPKEICGKRRVEKRKARSRRDSPGAYRRDVPAIGNLVSLRQAKGTTVTLTTVGYPREVRVVW